MEYYEILHIRGQQTTDDGFAKLCGKHGAEAVAAPAFRSPCLGCAVSTLYDNPICSQKAPRATEVLLLTMVERGVDASEALRMQTATPPAVPFEPPGSESVFYTLCSFRKCLVHCIVSKSILYTLYSVQKCLIHSM